MTKIFNTYLSKRFSGLLKTGMLSLILTAVVESANVLLAGRLLNNAAMEIVNLTLPIVSVNDFCSCFVTLGIPILYGEKVGEFDKDGANRIFSLGVIMAATVGILYVVLGLLLEKVYLGCYTIGADMYRDCSAFYKYEIISGSVKPLGVLFTNMILLDGDNLLVELSMITSFIAKFGLGVLLCLTMGIDGLGISNILAMTTFTGVNALHFLRKTNTFRFIPKVNARLIPQVLKYSILDACVYLYMSIITFYLNITTEHRFGIEAILIVSIITLMFRLYASLDGVGAAMSPIVNVYYGQKSYHGTKITGNLGMVWSLILAAVMALLSCIFAGTIVKFLGITDPYLYEVCVKGTRILSIGLIINGIGYCITSYYLYVDHIGLGWIYQTFNNLISLLIGMELCTRAFGIMGAFIGIPVGSGVNMIVFIVVLLIKYGRKRFPFIIQHEDEIKDDHVFMYDLEEKSIQDLQGQIETYLKEWGYKNSDIMKAQLLIEEVALYIRDENRKDDSGKAKVLKGECALILDKDITVIMCDEGKLIDLSDADRGITSLRSYVMTNYILRRVRYTRNLTTMGTNRCMFKISASD